MFAKRLLVVALMGFLFVILWIALELIARHSAHAREVTFRYVVPTVPGIEAAPSPHRFYRPQNRVRTAPSPGVYHLDAPAPGGRCGRLFEVISGPPEERGCYGWN